MKLSTLRMLSLAYTASLIVALAMSVQLLAQEQEDVAGSADHPTIITFDPLGSVFTLSLAINPAGAIAGTFFDDNNVFHGYVRAKDGTITTFEAPGAGTGPVQGTVALSINPAGAITGYYFDASSARHGFLRDRHGTFTTFDAPGAGTGPFQGTYADSINPAGAIAGIVFDDNNVQHGFVRAKDGTIATFEAPGAGAGMFQGTDTGNVCGLNPAGAIAGEFLDDNNVFHGYVRSPDGTITTFDVPGAGTGPFQARTRGTSTRRGQFPHPTLTQAV